MKKTIVGLAVVVALVLATMFLAGCGDDTTATTSTSEISTATTQAPATTTEAPTTSTEASTTTTPASEITFKYAHNFSIENLEDGCKVATDYAGVEFLLVPKGQQPPVGYEDLPTISIPVERAVFMSATQVCCLRPLDALDVVAGVASDRDSWYVDGIKEGIDAGTIQVIATGMGEPDYEKVVALEPDVVFAYTQSGSDSEKMYAKFQELGLTTFVENSWLEQDPLGRMELIKLMGAFVGKDAEATAYFDEAEGRAESIVQKVAGAAKPNVVYGLTMDGKTFYMDGGDTYTSKEVEMAGGVNVFADLEGGTSQVAAEEVYARAQDADVWIFSSLTTYFQGMEALLASAPLIADTKPFKDGNVWLYLPDYWQTVDLTDEIVADLAAIFHPDLFPDYTPKHFVKAQ
jgi:iron complex transport system substrate-binding protein